MAPGPIGEKAKAKVKKIQRIVWTPMSQPTPSESEIFFAFAFARSALALRVLTHSKRSDIKIGSLLSGRGQDKTDF